MPSKVNMTNQILIIATVISASIQKGSAEDTKIHRIIHQFKPLGIDVDTFLLNQAIYSMKQQGRAQFTPCGYSMQVL